MYEYTIFHTMVNFLQMKSLTSQVQLARLHALPIQRKVTSKFEQQPF